MTDWNLFLAQVFCWDQLSPQGRAFLGDKRARGNATSTAPASAVCPGRQLWIRPQGFTEMIGHRDAGGQCPENRRPYLAADD